MLVVDENAQGGRVSLGEPFLVHPNGVRVTSEVRGKRLERIGVRSLQHMVMPSDFVV